VNPERTYPFLTDLLQSFHKARRKTLGLVIAAVAVTGQARSFAIAPTLANWLQTRLDSAVNRFYRWLRNGRVDYLEFVTRWLDVLARRPDQNVLLAVDWTEWHTTCACSSLPWSLASARFRSSSRAGER
jgi:hypothetical protein